MPILVKTDDVRSGRKAKARHGRLRAAQESIDRPSAPRFEFLFIEYFILFEFE